MTNRHVYWRTPEGRPYKKDGEKHTPDDGKHAPVATLAAIGESASVQSGKISFAFPNLPFTHHVVLRSAAVVLDQDGRELNETDTWSIVIEAIHLAIIELGGGKPISPKQFMSIANRLASDFLRREPHDFVCVTTLSLGSFPSKPI